MKTSAPQTPDLPEFSEKTKKVFWKKGTCSQTFNYILDREFDHLQPEAEKATDPLAGGILQKGHQCGMLWGASFAVGSEAYRRTNNLNQAVRLAINATQHLIRSFVKRTKTVKCRTITGTDFSKPLQMLNYLLFRGRSCFVLADLWAPEAVKAAEEGLNETIDNDPPALSCASEVLKKMGGSDEEIATVAGLAGGLGLSGNACGALSAAIWKVSLKHVHSNPKKTAFKNPAAKRKLKQFLDYTEGEFMCPKLCGKNFDSIEDHTAFIENGGCRELIEVLAKD